MIKKELSSAKPALKTTLGFFNCTLSALNDKRLQLNRSKGLAKYLAKSKKNKRNIAFLDTSLGVMSFSLYMLRFLANIALLTELVLGEQEKTNCKKRRDLYFSLLNDSLWCAVNLSQFFWLSYRNSLSAGLRGMQLETLAQFIDILVVIVRYQHDKEEYHLKYNQATDIERARLAIEWQNKQFHVIRSLLTGLLVVVVFGLFSFSIVPVPVSPMVSAILLISSVLRILTDLEKDRQLLHQLKIIATPPQHIINEQRAMKNARMKNLNQVILNSVCLPMGLFLLLTTPIPLTIGICLSIVLIHYLLNHLINRKYSLNTSASSPFPLVDDTLPLRFK